LFVDHKGKDSHLSGTSLVEFDGTLLQLGFLCKRRKGTSETLSQMNFIVSICLPRHLRTIECVPSEVEGVVAEVANEFSSGNILHDGKFQETNEGNNLRNTSSGDGVEGRETVGDIRKGKAGVVNVSGQSDSCSNFGMYLV
jgi:hypothetical protein